MCDICGDTTRRGADSLAFLATPGQTVSKKKIVTDNVDIFIFRV